ncbi:MAG: alpha/beta hydrolase-fold protein [Phycisphaerales bacterium]|nr:alpha/beta hydrolase-fold protein [Phycisphaerales bacterium]
MIHLLLCTLLVLSPPAEPAPTRFIVQAPAEATCIPDSFTYTGRVYVFLGDPEGRTPRQGPDWFQPQPFFALDVKDWDPRTELVIDEQSLGYPGPVSSLPEQDWSVQAVLRGPGTSRPGSGPGTAHGATTVHHFGPANGDIRLSLDHVELDEVLPEVDGIEWVEFPSTLHLDAFGQPVMHRAAVMPPSNYDPDADGTWPTVYVIGGFPGSLSAATMTKWMWGQTDLADEAFIVHLDAECVNGHHAFVDSPGNGPRGTALVTEFIPHLESQWRMRSDPAGRLLTGHSSGGWSSLWLQVNWPTFFGGTWSTAPDPVDFRDFQNIDIYTDGANAFMDEQQQRRPIARARGRVLIWYDDFVKMERVLGDGGQIRSFDWTFSPLDESGRARRLIDPVTGAVDPEVAEAWKRSDINLVLQERWDAIGPDLAGKIHVIGGSEDTFYLEGALERLQQTLLELGSDAQILIVPGADHSNFMNLRRRRGIAREMLEQSSVDASTRS